MVLTGSITRIATVASGNGGGYQGEPERQRPSASHRGADGRIRGGLQLVRQGSAGQRQQ